MQSTTPHLLVREDMSQKPKEKEKEKEQSVVRIKRPVPVSKNPKGSAECKVLEAYTLS